MTTDQEHDTDRRTLAELVTERPERAAVFERFGLDYCCHGNRPLTDACSERGIDVDAVNEQLQAATLHTSTQGWEDLPIPELASHIITTHHLYLWDELPSLDALAEKVASVHGRRHPELAEVRALVAAVRADLEPHLRKEEMVLFPALLRLAAGERDFPFGVIGNPIRMMRSEHDAAGELLERLRAVTSGYVVPDDGCTSYRALYARLERLEADTHLHIHKENNVLFPAAEAL